MRHESRRVFMDQGKTNGMKRVRDGQAVGQNGQKFELLVKESGRKKNAAEGDGDLEEKREQDGAFS